MSKLPAVDCGRCVTQIGNRNINRGPFDSDLSSCLKNARRDIVMAGFVALYPRLHN